MAKYDYHIPGELLREPNKVYTLDSYYGVISFYGWHKHPSKTGSHFSPIFYCLDEIKKRFPGERKRIELIYRKSAYLNILEMELDYLSKRYDWKALREVEEIFLARFENLATILCEVILTSTNLYEILALRNNELTVNRFEEILPFFTKPGNRLPRFCQSPNVSINLSLYIYIRNSLIHNPHKMQYIRNDQNPIILIENIPANRRYGVFDAYIKQLFIHSSKALEWKKRPKSSKKVVDAFFPYIEIEFWIGKKSTVDLQKTKIRFEMDMVELAKKMLNDLFAVQRDILNAILNSECS